MIARRQVIQQQGAVLMVVLGALILLALAMLALLMIQQLDFSRTHRQTREAQIRPLLQAGAAYLVDGQQLDQWMLQFLGKSQPLSIELPSDLADRAASLTLSPSTVDANSRVVIVEVEVAVDQLSQKQTLHYQHDGRRWRLKGAELEAHSHGPN